MRLGRGLQPYGRAASATIDRLEIDDEDEVGMWRCGANLHDRTLNLSLTVTFEADPNPFEVQYADMHVTVIVLRKVVSPTSMNSQNHIRKEDLILPEETQRNSTLCIFASFRPSGLSINPSSRREVSRMYRLSAPTPRLWLRLFHLHRSSQRRLRLKQAVQAAAAC